MITRILFSLLFFASLLPFSSAQKHDYIWLTGNYNAFEDTAQNFTFDFNTFPPTIEDIDSKIFMEASSLSMSDSAGNLIFYSNGCVLRNQTHVAMQGGASINEGVTHDIYCVPSDDWGYYPAMQALSALPVSNNQYYMLHLRAETLNPAPGNACAYNALLFSQIDMNADNGLGEIVFKDSVLINTCLQVACANRHANGRDWWVLMAENLHEQFFRFLVTPEGVQGPWIQEIDNPTIDTFFYGGWSEFSPDGQHFAINHHRNGLAVYDFDRCTGLLSNMRYAPRTDPGRNYGLAFSPDSRYVYIAVNQGKRLDQYDLQASSLVDSRITAADWDGFIYYFPVSGSPRQTVFGYIQRAPDGKFYIWAGDAPYMHIVNFPNRSGANSQIMQRALNLPYYTIGANYFYPNYRLGPVDGSACDSLGIDNVPVALFRYDFEDTLEPSRVTFTDLSYYEPATWSWNFGDGATSADTSPVHTYQAAGTYNVCLTVSNTNGSDTYCRVVEIGTTGIAALPVLPQVRVTPNPFGASIRVQLPALTLATPLFRLIDVFGRPVREAFLTDFDTRIPAAGLPAGVYFWHYVVNGRTVQSGRLMKTER